MIALGIVQWLQTRYRVIVFSRAGGVIQRVFEDYAEGVVVLSELVDSKQLSLSILLEEIKKFIPLQYAIVNSIACAPTMQQIEVAGLPILLLVHEEPDEYLATVHVYETLLLPTHIIGPCQSTVDRWRAASYLFGKRSIQVHPQSVRGFPYAPLPESIQSLGDQTKIILGVGTVEPRKGVERFLECAAALARLNPPFDFRFIWVGRSIHPAIPPGYRNSLNRIRQVCELDSRVLFLKKLRGIGAFYERADAFFLSSVVDIFPSVALEALSTATPVVTFDQSNGVAEEMKKDAELQYNVAPFLDTQAIAKRLLDLLSDSEVYAESAAACRRFAAEFEWGQIRSIHRSIGKRSCRT
jgi:glycosyltransferase involved in cell wall biosynthesis